MSDEIFLESMSRSGSFYNISIAAQTCTCRYFNIKLKHYPLNDPRRLCKHLVKVLAKNGIPETLHTFKNDILLRASQGQGYIPAEYLSKNEKIPLPEGSIETITANRKTKYIHLAGIADEHPINASIAIMTGETSLQISDLWGSCSLEKKKCVLPKRLAYMEAALLKWLSDEYGKRGTI